MNLKGYEFIERISDNSNSETWAARKQDAEQIVTIKVLNKNTIDIEYYKTIIQNANKAKELEHSNIVKLYEVIEQEDKVYFIYENNIGKTIKETVRKDGVMPEKIALTISLCVVGMLEMAHRKKNISHGHISPSNIIIDQEGTVKLSGLGLPFDETERSFFTAPEQKADNALNALSDMYSMGTTIYYMLTAKESFSENDATLSVSGQTAEIITRLTHTHTGDRYTTWQEALTDIKAAISILPDLVPITGMNEAVLPEQAEPTEATIHKNKNPIKIPLWFRASAWLILFGFLGWFTYRQRTNPIVDKNTILSHEKNMETVSEEIEVYNSTQKTTLPSNNSQKILDSIRKQVVSSILEDNIIAAKQAITGSTSPEIQEQTDQLLKIIDKVTNPDRHIAQIFSDNLGQKTVIMFGQTRREIIPIAVSGINITAKLATENDNSESVTFCLKELSTTEKLRLLSSRTDETASLIKLLLNIKAGNIHEAKILAGSCGSLADAFTEQLNTE